MYAIIWKALRTFSRFCLPILLILSVTALYGATEEAWEMLESEHFQIYYQSDATQPQDIAEIAEDFYPHLNRLIDGIEMGKIEIWMCKTQEQFQAAAHAPIQDWAVGCAFPLSRRIVIQNPRVIIDQKFQLSQVLRHENCTYRFWTTHEIHNRRHPLVVYRGDCDLPLRRVGTPPPSGHV